MNDERKGLPSASGAERLMNCPRSWNLELKAKDLEPEEGEESLVTKNGSIIHSWLDGSLNDEDLTVSQLNTAQFCRTMENNAINAFPWQDRENIKIIREERHWLLNDDFEAISSGKADTICIEGDKALILDAKTGYKKVKQGEENLQLVILAVHLLDTMPSLRTITVGIIQPFAGMHVQLATFSSLTIKQWRSKWIQAIEDAKNDRGEFQMGEWCTYCKAKTLCPKQKENALHLMKVDLLSGQDRERYVSNEDLMQLREAISQAKRMEGMIEAEIKRRLEEGAIFETDEYKYELKEMRGNRKLSGAIETFQTVNAAFGISSEEFIQISNPSITKLQDLIQAKSGLKKGKAREEMDSILTQSGVMSSTPSKKLEKVYKSANLEADVVASGNP